MKKLIFILIIFFTGQFEAKFLSVPDKLPAAYCKINLNTRESNSTPIVNLQDILKSNNISYIKFHDSQQFNFEMFPIASSLDSSNNNPYIPESFVINIPQGRVYSCNGIILVNNSLIKELIWPWSSLNRDNFFNLDLLPKLQHIHGKVAVITQEGHSNYCHWMLEVLPKLAMLESKQIEYDRLYVTSNLPFMSETLNLLGVDSKKILEPKIDTYIEADQLIVPSFPSISCYAIPWVIDYFRAKFISMAEKNLTKIDFNRKIFISRKKAKHRKIINEDEIFDLFKNKGFSRYNLEDLSFLEQVKLFKNANIVVAPHGAGLLNLMFSKACTQVIEIFQEHEDDTFWYLSQLLGLKHHCIKTTEFKTDGGYRDTVVPIDLIRPVLANF